MNGDYTTRTLTGNARYTYMIKLGMSCVQLTDYEYVQTYGTVMHDRRYWSIIIIHRVTCHVCQILQVI